MVTTQLCNRGASRSSDGLLVVNVIVNLANNIRSLLHEARNKYYETREKAAMAEAGAEAERLTDRFCHRPNQGAIPDGSLINAVKGQP